MNVAQHAGLTAGMAQVVLRADADGAGGCVLVFEDDGRPFDPIAAPLPDPVQRLRDGEVGGLGLVLVHRFAAALSYARLPEGRNRFCVTISG